MQTIAVVVLAFACVFGIALAQYGYSPYGGVQSGSGGLGNGGLLALIGLLFLLMILFSTNKTTGTGSTTLIYGNYSG